MKSFFIKNYKSIFVLWLSLGVSISGYFYVNAGALNTPGIIGYKFWKFDYTNFQVSLLITIVGVILIVGFGNILSKKD
jgi:hypothetical protein